MEELFNTIKSENLEEIKDILNFQNMNTQDNRGRTPLIYTITQKSSVEIFDFLLQFGANPNIKDKLGDNAVLKAIKFKRIDIIKKLLNKGIELNSQDGIIYTPWFKARKTPDIADLLIETEGSVRLTLTESEDEKIKKLLYKDNLTLKDLESLNSAELIHAYIINFNWDDEVELINKLVDRNEFKEITAIEVIENIGDCYFTDYESEITEYQKNNIELVKNILEKFPRIEENFK